MNHAIIVGDMKLQRFIDRFLSRKIEDRTEEVERHKSESRHALEELLKQVDIYRSTASKIIGATGRHVRHR